METNKAPEKIYVEIKHPFSEEYTEMIAFEDGDGIEYTRTDVFIDKACEFWKHKLPYNDIDTIKEFVDAMKGE